MFQNVVIGTPLVPIWELISESENEFEASDKKNTLFTNERFLPAILVETGIVKSRGEVRRNKPDLCVNLDKPDCFWVKWGKQRLFVVVGE